jgi:hypothetical protein
MGTKILTQLEGLVKRLQLKYMDSKRTMEVVEEGRILFHPKDCRERIMLEYEKRLKKLKIR